MSDLISRQAAIEAIVNRETTTTRGTEYLDGYAKCQHDILDIINQLPSAQSERKNGRWISRDGEEDCYECSECHAVIEGDEVYWRNNYFCYHCGADMRGEDDVEQSD